MATLVAQGLTNREIAQKLFISARTSEYHVEQIRNKLGFNNRSQIAAWSVQGSGPATRPASAGPSVVARWPSRTRLLALGLVLALLTGGAVYFLARPSARLPAPDEAVVQLDGGSGRVVGTVSTHTRGSGLAIGQGSLWEVSYLDGTLARIDGVRLAVTSLYGVHGNAPPVGVVVGVDSVWVATAFGDHSLQRLDPVTGQWQQPVGLPSGLAGIVYGAGALWVSNHDDNVVYRVEPDTGAVSAAIPVGEGPESLTVGAGAVWVANAVGQTISRIDPGSNTVVATIALPGAASALASGEGFVWAVSEATNRLMRIDPETDGEVDAPFSSRPSEIVATDRMVWVAEGSSGLVARIDPSSLRTVTAVQLAGAVDGMAAGDGGVWVTTHVAVGPPPAARGVPRGGTLRVVVPTWDPSELASSAPKEDALDPQVGGGSLDSNEILRCCLLRTLTSHVGSDYRDGGAQLQPDLASGPPDESADGLTWTFRIRPGVYYAPPLQHTEITAGDFVRSLQRDARLARSTTFSVIQGFDAYAAGAAGISGLDTPTRYTLRVRLNAPTGDLPYRFALPESAPIPPSPIDQTAAYGVATGHDLGYGRYLVSSGPYMIEGSAQLDFSQPASKQAPVTGFQPSRHLVLVRNPSWRADIDPLRPAYAGQVEFAMGVTDEDAAHLLDSGQADLILHGSPPPQVMPWLIEKFTADPSLGRVQEHQRDFQRAVEMNLAIPPFDDIHVRRAVNYILDKQTLLDAHGGEVTGSVMAHYNIDSVEGGVLSGYRPYATAGDRGSLDLARNEIRQSRYDPGHSGMCSVPVCKHVLAVTFPSGGAPFARIYGGFPQLGAIIAGELSAIGITLDLRSTPAMVQLMGDPAAHIALDLTLGVGVNWMSASSSFAFDFTSDAVGGSLVGATPEQLRGWGYGVASVPNIDSRIGECMHAGVRQDQCWIALDVYVMEKLVPVAPYLTENVIDIVPNRVVHYSFDQSMDEVALDQIAVKG